MKTPITLLIATLFGAEALKLRGGYISGPIYNPNEPSLPIKLDHHHKGPISVTGPIYNPNEPSLPILLHPADAKFFSFGDIGKQFNDAVHQVTDTAQHLGNDISNTAQQVGNNVANTAQQVGNGISNTAQQVGSDIANAAQQFGDSAVNTAHQIGDNLANTAQQIGQGAQAFVDATGFVTAVNLWGKVNWNTGEGLVEAIQATAQADVTFFEDLDQLTGGRLTPQNLKAAEYVASVVFPPAAVVIQAGEITMNTGKQILNITNLVQNLNGDINSGNILGAAIDAFKLFKLITGY
jgi:gas vesicle protein